MSRMPILKVNSVNLYFEVAGAGRPILALTPLLLDHMFLRPFTQALAKKYMMISLDLLGHGSSDKPEDEKLYSYENLANHCYQLTKHVNIKKHDIVGISWSGRIALTYTLLHQDNVRALILIGSSGPKQKPTTPQISPEWSPRERFVMEIAYKMPYDVSKDLNRIQVPTLIIIGDKDPRLKPARFMHREIPKSTMQIIKGEGHEFDLTICVKYILTWLKNLPG
jgi:pimeloyl-ACP methyl ester carboxylesterase